MKKSTIFLNMLLASCILAILILSIYAYITDIKKSNIKHKFDTIPKITRDYDKTELNEIKKFKGTINYNENTKEIIELIDNGDITYNIVGKFGKLYTNPITITEDEIDNELYINGTKFNNYKVVREENYSYYLDKLNNKSKNYESIYGLCYYLNNTLKCDYLILDDTKKISLLNLKTDEIKELNEYYDDLYIIKDQDKYISNSNIKYIIASKDNKYGLIDYNENIVLNFEYDDLINYTNTDEYLAKKNDKYGIINSKNEVIINFEYDEIQYRGNYKILFKDGKVGVTYNNKLIVDFTILYSSYNYKIDTDIIDDNLYIFKNLLNSDNYPEYFKKSTSYLINKNGISKKIDSALEIITKKLDNKDKINYYYSISESNGNIIVEIYDLDFYPYYSFKIPYDKAYSYNIEIENYIKDTDYYKVKVNYHNKDNTQYFIDLFNSQMIDEKDFNIKYFDNGYTFILDPSVKLKIFKDDKLISEYDNIEHYLGGYYFSKNNVIYELQFKKES